MHSSQTLLTPCPTHALHCVHCSPTHHILTKYTPTHYTSHIQRDSQCCKHNTQTSQGSVSRLTINLLRKQMSPSRGWVKCTVSTVSSLCYSSLYKLTICWASPNICEVHKSICILSSHTVYGVHNNNDRVLLSIIQICICHQSCDPNRCSDHVM